VLSELCRERTPRPSWVFDELRALFRRADQRLADEIERTPDLRGMATTLTVGVALGRTLFVGHAGDSRCYVMRGGALRRITVDHTVAVELAKLGVIELEAVAEHPFRNVLSNYVGMGKRLDVEVHEVDLGPGDTVLLCTDGLTGMVPSPAIAAILRQAASPEQACRDLVTCANERGGEDNVTAVVARWALAA
jgi:protein phosphatase